MAGKHPNAIYCRAGCRQRIARGGKPFEATVVDLPARDDGDGPTAAATRAALTEVGRLDTPHGRAAMALAAKLDVGTDTATSMAAAARALSDMLAKATEGVARASSPLDARRDELARRRARRGA